MTPTPPTSAVPAAFSEGAATDINGAPLPVLDPAVVPNLDDLVTDDDTPLDSIYTEKQQRLLTEPLYSSWTGPGEGRPSWRWRMWVGFTPSASRPWFPTPC